MDLSEDFVINSNIDSWASSEGVTRPIVLREQGVIVSRKKIITNPQPAKTMDFPQRKANMSLSFGKMQNCSCNHAFCTLSYA